LKGEPYMIVTRVTNKSVHSRFRKRTRGATLVEYVVLMVAVMLICVAAFRSLGKKLGSSVDNASKNLDVAK
jgi:Flp pilus assembly pilin Flp